MKPMLSEFSNIYFFAKTLPHLYFTLAYVNPFRKLSNFGAIECGTKLCHSEKSELILSILKKRRQRNTSPSNIFTSFLLYHNFIMDPITKVGFPETDGIKKCEFKKGKKKFFNIFWKTSLEHVLLICQRLVICMFTFELCYLILRPFKCRCHRRQHQNRC